MSDVFPPPPPPPPPHLYCLLLMVLLLGFFLGLCFFSLTRLCTWNTPNIHLLYFSKFFNPLLISLYQTVPSAFFSSMLFFYICFSHKIKENKPLHSPDKWPHSQAKLQRIILQSTLVWISGPENKNKSEHSDDSHSNKAGNKADTALSPLHNFNSKQSVLFILTLFYSQNADHNKIHKHQHIQLCWQIPPRPKSALL